MQTINRDKETGRFIKTVTPRLPCVQCSQDLEVGRGLCRSCYGKYLYKKNKAEGKYANGQYRPKTKKEKREREVRTRRNSHLLRNFNITIDEYEKMEKDQSGVCLICKKTERNKKTKYLSVDHCHKTGKVRGLLCSRCNSAIGLLRDCPERITAALAYIKRHC